MIEVCALASGSNGNCYYVGNEEEAVLIDVGISRRQILKRLKEAKLKVDKIKAVFITHEHADHIRGLRVFSDMQNVPAFLTKGTYSKLRSDNHPDTLNLFQAGEMIMIGNIQVHSFLKPHDALEPCSFRVEIDGVNVGVMTDIGESCDELHGHLYQCDVAFLESNYDEQMLMKGPYPHYLKERVSSFKGHLSNAQAVDLVQGLGVDTPLRTIFLSHISADNNRVEVALDAFALLQNRMVIKPTSRYAHSEVYSLAPKVVQEIG